MNTRFGGGNQLDRTKYKCVEGSFNPESERDPMQPQDYFGGAQSALKMAFSSLQRAVRRAMVSDRRQTLPIDASIYIYVLWRTIFATAMDSSTVAVGLLFK
jgi:hypothetical protein